MIPSSRLLSRAGWILAALAAPWLVYACDLAPLGPGATATSTGAGGASTTTAHSSTSTASTSVASSSSTTVSSSSGAGGAAPDAGGDSGDAGDAAPVCNTTVVSYPLLPGIHVPVCSPITTWNSNPPTSGEHYPIWPDYGTYTVPVPRGFYLHDMEHGAIVILYNCPSGCDADLAQLAAWLDARPADPLCTPPVNSRITVTPDPLIPTRFAAAAWGWALTSECFDLPALGPFIDAHYAMAPEDFCNLYPYPGGAGFPEGCGEAVDDGGDGG